MKQNAPMLYITSKLVLADNQGEPLPPSQYQPFPKLANQNEECSDRSLNGKPLVDYQVSIVK